MSTIDQATRTNIVADFAAGMQTRTIAQRHGVSVTTVLSIARENGWLPGKGASTRETLRVTVTAKDPRNIGRPWVPGQYAARRAARGQSRREAAFGTLVAASTAW